MKLQSYNPNEKLNTINAQVANTGSAEAYGADNSGSNALRGAIDNAASQWLELDKKHDQLKQTQAINEYNQRINDTLYDKDNGLMNQKGSNAMTIMPDYVDSEKKIREDILAKYNMKMTDSINGFNNAVGQDVTNKLNLIDKYTRSEFESSTMQQMQNYVNTQTDNALVLGTIQSDKDGLKNIRDNLETNLKLIGFDDATIKAKVDEQTSQYATTVIDKKITDGAIDKAGDALNYFASQGLISEKALYKYRAQIKDKDVRLQINDDVVNKALAANNWDPDKSKAYLKKLGLGLPKMGGNLNGSPEDVAKALMGMTEAQESSGQADVVNKDSGATGLFQIMPDNWGPWAAEAGLGADAPMTPENQRKVYLMKMSQYVSKFGLRGAIGAWYGGEGVGQAIANGQNGYNGWSFDDRQGDNGEYPSVNEYISQTLGQVQANYVPTQEDLQKQDQLIDQYVNRGIQQHQQKIAIETKNAEAQWEQRRSVLLQEGATDVQIAAERQAFMSEQSPDVQKEMMAKTNSYLEQANNEKRQEQNALKANDNNMYNIKALFGNGINSRDDIQQALAASGLSYTAKQIDEIYNAFDDYQNGRGSYSPNMSGVRDVLETQLGSKIDGAEWAGVSDAIMPEVNEYRASHGGAEPPQQELLAMASRALIKSQQTYNPGRPFGIGNITINASPAELAAYGIAHTDIVQGDDGGIYVVATNMDGTTDTTDIDSWKASHPNL